MKGKIHSNQNIKHATGVVLAAMIMLAGTSTPVRKLGVLPDSIHLTQGYSTQISLPAPFNAALKSGEACALSDMDQALADIDPSYTLTAESPGNDKLVLSLLGVPLKTVAVNIAAERVVVPGGQSIGVALNVGGALVVGTSDIAGTRSPARVAGLKPGDRITHVDGKKISSANDLSATLNGDTQLLTVVRNDSEHFVPIKSMQDERDDQYRLGAWVRDSTAGVGTLSFYDPESGMFGALGHAITDVDTGTVLPVSEGYIYESQIIGLQRGQSGEPGELLGEFFNEDKQIGSVDQNSELGLYGESDEPMLNSLYPTGVKLMQRSEVKTGPAKLITTIAGKGMQEYDCEILRLFHQDSPQPRSMVVKITDEKLLSTTGGIVQGMSGSPILQDGRLVGAITHVFINDPTQGYGLYAEWMIEQSQAA